MILCGIKQYPRYETKQEETIMSTALCRLCLFKSEPEDEIFLEDSKDLQKIIEDLFKDRVRSNDLPQDQVLIQNFSNRFLCLS